MDDPSYLQVDESRSAHNVPLTLYYKETHATNQQRNQQIKVVPAAPAVRRSHCTVRQKVRNMKTKLQRECCGSRKEKYTTTTSQQRRQRQPVSLRAAAGRKEALLPFSFFFDFQVETCR